MLILTYADANTVRGLTIAGHALAPVPLKDGTFALPVEVLNDPAHESKWAIMMNFDITADSNIRPGIPTDPSMPGSPIVGGDWETDPTICAAHAYDSSWPVGELVVVAPPPAAPRKK